MNKRGLVGALLVAGAVTGASAAVANGGGSERAKPPLRFEAIGKLDRAHVVDHQEDGLSPGDVLTFTQTLHNRTDTRVIGSSRAVCTQTPAARGDSLCTGVFVLRGRGEITIEGIEPGASVTRHPLVVTGGSGDYRGVRGEITVRHVSPTEDRFRFILSR